MVATGNATLSLYRRMLRTVQSMPKSSLRLHVDKRVRAQFRKDVKVTDKKEVQFLLNLGETNLDTIIEQKKTLEAQRHLEMQEWRAIR